MRIHNIDTDTGTMLDLLYSKASAAFRQYEDTEIIMNRAKQQIIIDNEVDTYLITVSDFPYVNAKAYMVQDGNDIEWACMTVDEVIKDIDKIRHFELEEGGKVWRD